MDTLIYPLLYYKLREDAYLGVLVGTDHKMVDKDTRSIRAALNDHLKSRYKRFDEYPYSEIKQPKLKVFDVKVRPAYKNKIGAYPLSETIKVPVVTVHGDNGNGYYICHLPMFEESFYYYDVKQFRSLVMHFAANILNQKTPEEIYQYIRQGIPELDQITLRVNYNREFNDDYIFKREPEVLLRLAEAYPPSKSVRKSINAFPEAAWELEDKVLELMEHLVNLRANVLLIGASGCGKSSVLKQAIKKIVKRGKKENLEYTFWRIMPQRIVASAKYLGEWQENVEHLVYDLGTCNGILWVDDFIRLLQIGGEGPEDSVAAFMTSYLQQGKLQLVGEVSPAQLESLRRFLPGFVDLFQLVHLEKLPELKVFLILDQFSDYCEKNLKVKLLSGTQQLAYRLLQRYYPYQGFPGKAIRFLSKAVSEAKIDKKTSLNKQEIISQFVKMTGLPELFLRDDMLLDQAALKAYFDAKIIGQPAAIDQLCNIVKIFKAGLNNPHKPITTLIFAGPTGVGKTASAKALADYFFGEGQGQTPLIRIDMSEFQHPSQITQFIGSGRETGKLVKDIREKPFAVLLLDEVEKADSSIFDALLTVLDEGMLVDAYGRVTNFRNAIIIMTTNLGASNRRSLGFSDTSDESAQYESAIGKFFRPEFVNRVDGIVMFNALNQANIKEITIKELEELKQREGLVKKGIRLKFDESIIEHLSKEGFDPKYGARPLQRKIEQLLVAPLANWLLVHPETSKQELRIVYKDKQVKIK